MQYNFRLFGLYACTLILLYLNYCGCIKCFKCETEGDNQCLSEKKNIVDCAETDSFCMTMIEEAKKTKERKLIRRCAAATQCQEAATKGVKCELCSVDLCNSGKTRIYPVSALIYCTVTYILTKLIGFN